MKTKLMNDLKEAMKNKDEVKKSTVQLIRSAILQFEKDNQKEIDDNKIIEIIAKEKKKRLDVLSDFEKADRKDLIEKTNKEIEILDQYLPKQLSDKELENEIKRIINELNVSSSKEMGIVMKSCKEQIGNKADGKRISIIVKELLSK